MTDTGIKQFFYLFVKNLVNSKITETDYNKTKNDDFSLSEYLQKTLTISDNETYNGLDVDYKLLDVYNNGKMEQTLDITESLNNNPAYSFIDSKNSETEEKGDYINTTPEIKESYEKEESEDGKEGGEKREHEEILNTEKAEEDTLPKPLKLRKKDIPQLVNDIYQQFNNPQINNQPVNDSPVIRSSVDKEALNLSVDKEIPKLKIKDFTDLVKEVKEENNLEHAAVFDEMEGNTAAFDKVFEDIKKIDVEKLFSIPKTIKSVGGADIEENGKNNSSISKDTQSIILNAFNELKNNKNSLF